MLIRGRLALSFGCHDVFAAGGDRASLLTSLTVNRSEFFNFDLRMHSRQRYAKPDEGK